LDVLGENYLAVYEADTIILKASTVLLIDFLFCEKTIIIVFSNLRNFKKLYNTSDEINSKGHYFERIAVTGSFWQPTMQE
jgi:hypothetical protein